ncbi:nuclear transport factor 2 family protein [Chitinivorax sp. B]|uniref:nuclear transport factor 2 family protein n=1 Tax=Chitinivorax sp. B TaxID=2502235 RepID=UPI0010F88534|nr:nuclear transport factor 2 family protein [Chitinivorax sp. B]
MQDLLTLLQALETSLHDPTLKGDADYVSRLLHQDFLEFGRSGTSYDKASICASLAAEYLPVTVWAQDFSLKVLGGETALPTCRSTHFAADSTLERHTLRSSIWVRVGQQWQVIFHQGTATPAFEKSTN